MSFLARRVEVMLAGKPAALHWILAEVPNENDIQISGEEPRTKLRDAFLKVQGEGMPLALDPRDQLSLAPRIQKQLPAGSTFAITGPSDFLEKPKAPTSMENICVSFSLRFKGGAPIGALSIRVVTAAAAQAAPAERTIAPVSLNAQVSPPDPRVTANVEYAPQDVQSLTADQLKQALADVASRAFLAARDRNLIPGKPAPQINDPRDTRLGDASSEVSRVYQLHSTALGDPNWPEPRARLDILPVQPQSEFCLDDAEAPPAAGGAAEPRLEFCIDNAQAAASARVQMVFDDQFQLRARDRNKGTGLLKSEDEVLEGRFQALLASLAGAVPTQPGVLAVVKGLSAAPEIEVDAMHKITVTTEKAKLEGSEGAKGPPPGRTLWFQAFHRWRGVLGFKTKGELSYSPEKKFLGGGDFDGDNLMRLRETESLKVKAGNQVQTASGSLIVDRHKKAQYGARADGKFEYNANQRFGNLLGPNLRARDESITPEST